MFPWQQGYAFTKLFVSGNSLHRKPFSPIIRRPGYKLIFIVRSPYLTADRDVEGC